MRIRINDKNKIDVKAKSAGFQLIHHLEAMQQTEDILMAGKLGHAELGTSTLSTVDCITTNYETAKATFVESQGSVVMGANVGKEMKEVENLKIDGEDMGFKVRLQIYETGWVLKTGKQGANLFGATYNSYLKSIGTKNIRSCSKSGAKIFASKKAVLSYIESHRSTFEYCVEKHGYWWSLEPANKLFEEDYQEELLKMTSKKHESEELLSKNIEKALNEVNASESKYDMQDESVPECPTEEDIKAEAVFRMKKMHLWASVISRYKKDGTIFQSETGGIIYDLDENAKEAVAECQKRGLLPYHVVVTNTNFGKLYAVLYVSEYSKEWQGERMDPNGTIINYTYNSTYKDCSELGYSRYLSTNGGLMQTA